MLEKNQCLPQFHQLIIPELLYKILGKQNGREEVGISIIKVENTRSCSGFYLSSASATDAHGTMKHSKQQSLNLLTTS